MQGKTAFLSFLLDINPKNVYLGDEGGHMALHATLAEWGRKNKKQKETWAHFLTRVLDDKILSRDFLKIIVTHPRENKATYRALGRFFPNASAWHSWQRRYAHAYEQFMHTEWQKAKRIEDVLKIIPNFSPWALKDRFGSIRIGQIPTEFGGERTYEAFLKKIYNHKVMQQYRMFKSLESDLKAFTKVYPEVKKIDWFDLEERSAFLSKTLHKIIGKPFRITQAGHVYRVRYLCNPFSCKMVFIIESDTKQKYVLKMAAHQVGKIVSDAMRKESENQAIRADSPYSHALMEFYLKLNKCPHAVDILYYTDTYEAVLYRAQTGKEFNECLDFKTLNHRYLKDANRLGIYINDVAPHNFVWGRDQKLKIIDIGHACFANPLTQGIPGLTFSFGNLCGQDYLIHFGVLSMED